MVTFFPKIISNLLRPLLCRLNAKTKIFGACYPVLSLAPPDGGCALEVGGAVMGSIQQLFSSVSVRAATDGSSTPTHFECVCVSVYFFLPISLFHPCRLWVMSYRGEFVCVELANQGIYRGLRERWNFGNLSLLGPLLSAVI